MDKPHPKHQYSDKFSSELELWTEKRVREILDNYPDQLPYVPEGLEDLTNFALEMY